jgi:hypothetical protein
MTFALNQKGNLLLGTILIIIVIMLLPLVLKTAFPLLDIVFKLVLIFGVYSFVRGFLGDSTLTLLVTGILIYFMVFKYSDLFTSLWFISLVMGLGISTFIVIVAKDFLGFGSRH